MLKNLLFLENAKFLLASLPFHSVLSNWNNSFPFPILLGIYLGVKLLSDMVILCLTFWRNIKLFPIAAAPHYILTSKWTRFQFLHTLTNTCHFLLFSLFFFIFMANLLDMKGYPIVVLICNSLTSNLNNFLIYLPFSNPLTSFSTWYIATAYLLG